MAFSASGLTRMAGGGGNNIWYYTSADAIADVHDAGYFSGECPNMMNVGDVVFVHDSATPTLTIALVNANDGTTVDITDGTAIDVTDDEP
jgi:hypothetical protein